MKRGRVETCFSCKQKVCKPIYRNGKPYHVSCLKPED